MSCRCAATEKRHLRWADERRCGRALTVLWLLDTCVVSETFQTVPDLHVTAWLQVHGADAALPVVALGEILYGIERLGAGRPRNELQLWFDGLTAKFSQRTLLTDEPVWRAFARLKASVEAIGRPQDDMDLLIAATATVHQLVVVTRNVKHFQDSGVKVLNPWQFVKT